MGRQPKRFYKKATFWLVIALVSTVMIFVPPYFLNQESYIIINFTNQTYTIDKIPEISNLTARLIRIDPIFCGDVSQNFSELFNMKFQMQDESISLGNVPLYQVKQRDVGVIRVTGDCYVLGLQVMIDYTNNFSDSRETTFTKYFIDPDDLSITPPSGFEPYFLPRGFTMTITIADLYALYAYVELNDSTAVVSGSVSTIWNPFSMFGWSAWS